MIIQDLMERLDVLLVPELKSIAQSLGLPVAAPAAPHAAPARAPMPSREDYLRALAEWGAQAVRTAGCSLSLELGLSDMISYMNIIYI